MAQSNRYSRMIAWVKVALPLLAIAILSTLFLFARAPDPDAALPFSDVDISEVASEQRVTRPRFASTLIDGRSVTFMADEVVTVGSGTNEFLLSALEGRVELPDDHFLIFDSGEAVVHMGTRTAAMGADVHIVTSQGYALTTESLSMGFERFELSSGGVVGITGPGIDLTAGRMSLREAQDGGALVDFTDGVRLLYDPQP